MTTQTAQSAGRFADKTILITGATSGLGLAGAERVIAEGGRVIGTGLNSERIDAAKVVLGPEATVVRNDAANPDAAQALAAVATDHGGLDGVWLNAGYAAIGGIDAVTASDFDAIMAANVRGPMLQLAALQPSLHARASVLVTSSTASYDGSPFTPLYAATKAALVALARCWSTELSPRGIRVNTLVPGPVESRLRDFLPEEMRGMFEESVVEQVPLGRVGTAAEAAAVATFLLSDDASYVTGSQYVVDGGLVRH